MKFSKTKRYKIKRKRDARINELYKRLDVYYSIDDNFFVISKRVIRGNYLLLCKSEHSNCIKIVKLSSADPTTFTTFSNKKNLKFTRDIKEWLNDFNSSYYSKHLLLKLKLNENGVILAKSTIKSNPVYWSWNEEKRNSFTAN